MRNVYYIYILTIKRDGTLHTGLTSNLFRRLWEHKNNTMEGLTKKYAIQRLVYHESFYDIQNAIAREKQIKAGSRKKKIALIEAENPHWKDLSGDWYS